MSEPVHRIRWKGRIEGPYTLGEIRNRLADGDLSLLHRIEVSGDWIGLGEFLSPEKPARRNDAETPALGAPSPARVAPPAVRDHAAPGQTDPETLSGLGYFLCGLCFVFPLLATAPAVTVALRLRRRGEEGAGRAQLLLAALFTLLGFLFWIAVRSAGSRGMI